MSARPTIAERMPPEPPYSFAWMAEGGPDECWGLMRSEVAAMLRQYAAERTEPLREALENVSDWIERHDHDITPAGADLLATVEAALAAEAEARQ